MTVNVPYTLQAPSYVTPLAFFGTKQEKIAQMKIQLAHSFLRIVFTKKSDGSERVLFGTTLSEYIQETKKSGRVFPEGIIPVWDIETDAWRSFDIESLISAELVHEPKLWEEYDNRIHIRETDALRQTTDGQAAVA